MLSFLMIGRMTQGAAPGDRAERGLRITEVREKDAPFDRFRGVMTITTRVESFKELMRDIRAYPTWLHHCKEVRLLKGTVEQGRVYLYFIYAAPALPWYLFMAPRPPNRDMVLRMEWREEADTGKLTVYLVNVDPSVEPELEDVVVPVDSSLTTVKKTSVSWELTPLPDSALQIVHEMYIDPDHHGPDLGIINRYVKNILEQTMLNVRTLLDGKSP